MRKFIESIPPWVPALMQCVGMLLISLFLLSLAAHGQTTDCPTDKVCISPEAARKALEDSDNLKALQAEKKITDQAIIDLKGELEKMRIEFVRASTELTTVKQQRVEDRALFEFVLKNQRRKCYPLSICIGT